MRKRSLNAADCLDPSRESGTNLLTRSLSRLKTALIPKESTSASASTNAVPLVATSIDRAPSGSSASRGSVTDKVTGDTGIIPVDGASLPTGRSTTPLRKKPQLV